MDSIGSRLKSLRKEKGLTLKQLSTILGVSHGNISDWESERSKPSSEAIINISSYFNVSADWILKGKEFENEIKIETNSGSFDPLVEESLKDDPELYSFWQTMMDREDLKLLFKKSKPLKPKTVKQIIAWIKAVEDAEAQED